MIGPPLELEADLVTSVDEKNIHVSSFSGQKVQQLETNYNDSAFEMEALPIEKTTLSRGNEDVEVNIIGCTRSSEPLIREDTCDDDDAAECSSSFGDTGSGTENASAFSDDEVTSYMYAKDPFSPMFYGDSEPGLIRRKKLTRHWESFRLPLMWRCKWLELKLKQLQSQERKYEKELAAYEYRRKFVTENFSLDGCDTKSIPLPVGLRGKKVIKRKKSKRMEQTCNLASYTSDPRVLSYFEKRDRAADARLKNANSYLQNVKGVAEAANNPESNEELFKWNDDMFSHLENDLSSSLKLNDIDKALVKMFERIEAARFEVHKLRTRIDKAVHGNVVKSSSVNYSNKHGLVPSNGLNPYNPNLASTFRIKESVEEHKSVSQAQASAPDVVARNVVPSNGLNPYNPNLAPTSRVKNTSSARNQLMRKTKESVEEHKSVSQAQASAPDLLARNVVPSNSLNPYNPNSAPTSRIKFTSSARNQLMRKTKESVEEHKSVSQAQASAPDLVARNVPSNGLNPYNPNSAPTSRIKFTSSARNQLMRKTKESVEEHKSVSQTQASAPDLVARNVVPSNGLNPYNPNSAPTSRIKFTSSARNQLMRKTKESVEEHKSVSQAQASAPDLLARNVVPSNGLNPYNPNSAPTSRIKFTSSARNQLMRKTKESVEEHKSVSQAQASAPDLVARNVVPSNGLNPYNPNSAPTSRIKFTSSARNQLMRKTKESVEEHKSVSQAQASAPDLVARNVVPSNSLNPYNPNSAPTSRIKFTSSARNQLMRKTKESVEEHKSVSQAQASAPDLVARNVVPSNGLNPYNPNSAPTSRIKFTSSARNQLMRKTKESVEEHKSVSQAQASTLDLVAKNVVPNLLSDNLKDCSPSKSNVRGKKRGKRKKSGSNWGGWN